MKVIGRNVLHDFCQKHVDVASQINSWLCEAQDAQWQRPTDVKQRFPQASILSDNRIVFNLKGNRYRLVVQISYEAKTVLVKRIGTHAEYSKWTF